MSAEDKLKDSLIAKLKIAVEALHNIENPILEMQKSLPEGAILNGGMAVQLSQDHNYLKKIAREALGKIEEKTRR